MFKQIIVFFALCATQLIVTSSDSMFTPRVYCQITQTVEEVDAVFRSPVYILPSMQYLKFILLQHGAYTDEEINTLQGQKLTANELLWELLQINENKQNVWHKNQPTIFQLVDRIVAISTASCIVSLEEEVAEPVKTWKRCFTQ